MAAGSGMAHGCICRDYAPELLELHAPQLFCPICRLRPAITRLSLAGETLFPCWTDRRVPQELRVFANAREWRYGNRMGAHSFRRGGARAILEAGGSCPQLLRSDQWRSSAYQSYVGLGREGSGAVASMLIEASGEDQLARMDGRSIGG